MPTRIFLGAVSNVILAIVIVWSGGILATDVTQKKAQPPQQKKEKLQRLLPSDKLYTREEIRKGFINMRVTPFNDPKFYFEISVPKDWDSRPLEVTRQQLAEDDKALVPMAKLTPNDEKENAVIEVYYMRVPPHATLERLVNVFAEQTGATIVARQRGEFNQRKVEDALLRIDRDFGSMLTRFTASRRGEFIFVVACSAPEAEYPKYKRMFGFAAVTFDPSGKTSETQLQPGEAEVAGKGAGGSPRFATVMVTDDKERKVEKTVFRPETGKVYVVFTLADVPGNTPVKIIWIAEKVEGEQANSQLTDHEIRMGGPVDQGSFSLGPPTNRWPVGTYRAELYLAGKLVHTARFRVEAR